MTTQAQAKELLALRLAYIAANPGCSLNALYINTSPACRAKGLKKSQGTYNWTVPRTLRTRGLVEVQAVNTHMDEAARRAPGVQNYALSLTLKGWMKLRELQAG